MRVIENDAFTIRKTCILVLSLQAIISRDALAKKIYSELFTWIVGQINKIIQPLAKSKSFIGVLDIYG